MKKHIKTQASTIQELLRFFWKERLWWMIPFVVVLLVVALLLLFAQSSPIIPFLYTAF
jgi:uncharacterized membrane protein